MMRVRVENGNQRMKRRRGVLFLYINLYKFEYSRNNSLSMILTFRDFEKIAGCT